MKIKTYLFLIALLTIFESQAQKHPDFKIIKQIKSSSVKDQARTGTCWSFATISFIETEAIRKGKKEYNLSEMYAVRNEYLAKADYYIKLHGLSNFSQGGQGHDVINAVKEYGIVPESVYSGKQYVGPCHNHSDMEKLLKTILDYYAKNDKKLSPNWKMNFTAVLDANLGNPIDEFNYDGKKYTPKSFMKNALDFNPDDYIEFTSYTDHKFYEKYDLQIPDNWSHDMYYNVPINELMQIIDNALNNGYSVDWDGDVSEKGFDHRAGKAELSNSDADNMLLKGYQEYRQETFEDYTTTDDHLMHITGIAQDKSGNKYYLTKNSWNSNSNKYGGYLYMSESYVQLKTIAILVHKDAVPNKIAKKIGIK